MNRSVLWLFLVAVVLGFTRLGDYGLMDVDEPRNAGCAAEMWARQDWVVPTFNGELRPHKPALTYWLMMVAYGGLGVNEFSARVASAGLGVLTVMLTYGIGRRMFDAETGFWAGMMLVSALFFSVASRIATPDAPLVFAVTLTMYFWVRATFRGGGNVRREVKTALSGRGAVAVYAAMGLAALAKGPIGVLLPAAIMGLFALLMSLPVDAEAEAEAGGARTIKARLVSALKGAGWILDPRHVWATIGRLRPLTAVGVIGLVAGPWYVAVHRATHGAFTDGFFLTHNLERATRAMEGHGGPALWYYPLIVFGTFFPASCFLVPALRDAVRRVAGKDDERPALMLGLCWVGGWIGAFSIASTKLPSYITPAFPGLALLVAAAVVGWKRRAVGWERRSLRGAWLALMGAGLTVVIGLAVAANVMFGADAWVGLVGVIPMLGGWVGVRQLRWDERGQALVAFGVSAALFTLSVLAGVLPYLSQRHQHGAELLALAELQRMDRSQPARVVAYGALEPSLVFNARRSVPLFEREEGEALREALAEPDTFVVARDRDLERLEGYLPAGFELLATVPYFGRPDLNLVLVGRPRTGTETLP